MAPALIFVSNWSTPGGVDGRLVSAATLAAHRYGFTSNDQSLAAAFRFAAVSIRQQMTFSLRRSVRSGEIVVVIIIAPPKSDLENHPTVSHQSANGQFRFSGRSGWLPCKVPRPPQ